MIKLLKNLAKKFLIKANLYPLLSLRKSGPLHEDGWFRSVKEQASIDLTGSPIPWITYPALAFIQSRIKKDMLVFEYGAGGSTLWWANRVQEVISVEHDYSWFKKINRANIDNIQIFHIDLVYGGDYCKAAQRYNKHYDIIVVDGRDRVNCIINCIGNLKPSGVILLDNSDRLDYLHGIEFLKQKGFRKIEFIGFSPIVTIKNETSIFYRDQNCLEI